MKHKTLIENTFPLPLLLRNETSKPLPIAIATLLQREGVLTFRNCRKYREIGFWKPLLVANFAENDPQMASKACLKDGKWTPRSPAPLAITFHGVWGTLLGKPSWNEPKTLKPYFSVWPNATGRGFDVSLLIWVHTRAKIHSFSKCQNSDHFWGCEKNIFQIQPDHNETCL